MQNLRLLHGCHIRGKIGAGAFRDQIDAGKVNIKLNKFSAHAVHTSAHIVKLFIYPNIWDQAIFQRADQIPSVGKLSAEADRGILVSHNQGTAVNVDDDRKFSSRGGNGLKDIHEQFLAAAICIRNVMIFAQAVRGDFTEILQIQ